MADTKKFLDLSGLNKFWQLISGKLLADFTVAVDDTEGAVFTKTLGNGTTSTELIPYATTSNGGLMSKDQVAALNNVAGDIETKVTLKKIQIGGNDVTIKSDDKSVNFKLNYNSDEKLIELIDVNKNDPDPKKNVLSSIDAKDFVKDGMVSSGTLIEKNNKTYIQISFNTPDGPSTPVEIDVTKLVDTYTAGNGINIEAGTSGSAVSIKLNDANGYLAVDANGLSTTDTLKNAIDAKADKTTLNSYYNKTEVDNKFNEVNATLTNDYYTADAVDGLLNGKVDTATLNSYYNKTEVDGKLADKADKTTLDSYYNKTEVDNKLATKADASALGNYYTKTEVDGKFTEVNNSLGTLDGRIDDVLGIIEENEEITAAALVDLDSRVTDNTIALDNKLEAGDVSSLIDSKIQELDSNADVIDSTNKKIATGLTQTDGKLSTTGWTSLTLDYISDFGVISDSEIEGIFV